MQAVAKKSICVYNNFPEEEWRYKYGIKLDAVASGKLWTDLYAALK